MFRNWGYNNCKIVIPFKNTDTHLYSIQKRSRQMYIEPSKVPHCELAVKFAVGTKENQNEYSLQYSLQTKAQSTILANFSTFTITELSQIFATFTKLLKTM